MAGLTIGAFAKAVGVRPDTIRYYERNGLLPHPARSSAGYRLYAESDLERVRFIVSADGTFQLPISAPSEINTKFHVHKTGPSTPYDGVAGRRVSLASEIAAESCDLCQVT